MSCSSTISPALRQGDRQLNRTVGEGLGFRVWKQYGSFCVQGKLGEQPSNYLGHLYEEPRTGFLPKHRQQTAMNHA